MVSKERCLARRQSALLLSFKSVGERNSLGRSRRSTPSAGKPRAWGRAAVLACLEPDRWEGTRPVKTVKVEQTHLAKLAAANPDKRFRRLYRRICDPDWLNAALDAIRSNKGFNTPGTDGVKGDELDQAQIDRLAEHLRQGTYHPTPVRRVFIPKR